MSLAEGNNVGKPFESDDEKEMENMEGLTNERKCDNVEGLTNERECDNSSGGADKELRQPVGFLVLSGGIEARMQSYADKRLLSSSVVILILLGAEFAESRSTDGESQLVDETVVEENPPSLTNMRVARSLHGACISLKLHSLFVAGGTDGVRCLKSVERFNVLEKSWTPMPNLHLARTRLALCADSEGRVVAVGGDLSLRSGHVAKAVEMFDPYTFSWRALSPLAIGRQDAAVCCFILPANLLIRSDVDRSEEYDPSDEPGTSSSLQCRSAMLFVVGGRSEGGSRGRLERSAEVLLLPLPSNPIAPVGSPCDKLSTDKYSFALEGFAESTRFSGIGTATSFGQAVERAQSYDMCAASPLERDANSQSAASVIDESPVYSLTRGFSHAYHDPNMQHVTYCLGSRPANSKQWCLVSSMKQVRACPGVISYGEKIIVCGGTTGIIALNSVEIYDPQTDIWETGPPMRYARSAPCLFTVKGRLLVCGGTDSSQRFVTLVEYWEPFVDSEWRLLAPEAFPVPTFLCGLNSTAFSGNEDAICRFDFSATVLPNLRDVEIHHRLDDETQAAATEEQTGHMPPKREAPLLLSRVPLSRCEKAFSPSLRDRRASFSLTQDYDKFNGHRVAFADRRSASYTGPQKTVESSPKSVGAGRSPIGTYTPGSVKLLLSDLRLYSKYLGTGTLKQKLSSGSGDWSSTNRKNRSLERHPKPPTEVTNQNACFKGAANYEFPDHPTENSLLFTKSHGSSRKSLPSQTCLDSEICGFYSPRLASDTDTSWPTNCDPDMTNKGPSVTSECVYAESVVKHQGDNVEAETDTFVAV